MQVCPGMETQVHERLFRHGDCGEFVDHHGIVQETVDPSYFQVLAAFDGFGNCTVRRHRIELSRRLEKEELRVC